MPEISGFHGPARTGTGAGGVLGTSLPQGDEKGIESIVVSVNNDYQFSGMRRSDIQTKSSADKELDDLVFTD